MSLATINLMERTGRANYQTVTKAVVEQALGWAPGSIDALLAGGDATVLEEPQPEPSGVDIAGPGFVAQVKDYTDLPTLLEQLPPAARSLWERLATAIAQELVEAGQPTADVPTISDDVLTAETDFGRTYVVTTTNAAPAKAQVERAAEQLRTALDLLSPHTERSVQ